MFFCVFLFSLNAFGQNEYSERVKSVSVFKNQRAFFRKDVRVKSDDSGYVHLRNLPNAQFGTFWINVQGTKIAAIKTSVDTVLKNIPLRTKIEQIDKNMNKMVTLHLRQREGMQNQLTGRFVQIGNDYVIFKTEDQWITIDKGDIGRIYYDEKPVLTKPEKSINRSIQIEIPDKSTLFPFELSYLRDDISWLPGYRVVILDDKRATLKLQALLLNDAESFVADEMNLVVGVPNFRFNNVLSPMVSGQSVKSVSKAIDAAEKKKNNNPDNYRITFSPETYEEVIELIPEEERETVNFSGQQDLFFYTINGIRSDKGSRALFDVLDMEVPMEHIYTAKLKDNFGNNGKYQQRASAPSENTVIHKIKLTNNSKVPWATGTAMVFNAVDNRNPQPISEDKLNFTSPYGVAYLKITQTPEIQVAEKEKELERTEKVQVGNSYYYNYLKMEADITVKNYKQEKVTVEITKPIIGKLEKSSEKWKITNTVKNGVNPNNTVKWNIQLKAGEEKTMTYTYFVYIR